MVAETDLAIIDDADYDRRKYVGGSNVAAIIGHGPEYGGEKYTALDVYLSKTAPTPAEALPPHEKLFLERRKRWEPVVIRHLKEEFEAEIVATNRRFRDPGLPFFASEIDFEWRVDAETAAALDLPAELVGSIQNGEIKTVHAFKYSAREGWGEQWSGDVPIYHEAQAQFGLGITGRQVCLLPAMVGIDSMVFYVIRRHDGAINRLRDTCARFWTENVLARVPPAPTTVADLDALYPTTKEGLEVTASSEAGAAALRLRSIYMQIDALEAEAEFAEYIVRREMKDAETLVVEGRKVATWKTKRWGRLDQAALKEQEKAIWKKYFLSGTHRVFQTLRSAPKAEGAANE